MLLVQNTMNFVSDHQAMILGVLFGVSEALSMIPGVESNGVFQLVFNFLKDHKPQK